MITLAPLAPRHEAALTALADEAFGPGRFAKTAYRIRSGIPPLPELSLGAFAGAGRVLVGSIQFTPVQVAGQPLLLLGPLVVSPDFQGQRVGLKLLEASLKPARQTPALGTVLIGDAPYYRRVGFAPLPAGEILLPGPFDPDRFLGLSHHGADLAQLSGPLTGGWDALAA